MGDEDKSGVFLYIEIKQQIHELGGAGGIKRASRFVSEEQARLADEGPDHGDTLALAAGKLGRLFIHMRPEADPVQ